MKHFYVKKIFIIVIGNKLTDDVSESPKCNMLEIFFC